MSSMSSIQGSTPRSSPLSTSPHITILFVSLVAIPLIAMITALVLRYYPDASFPILSASATLAVLSMVSLALYWVKRLSNTESKDTNA